MNENDNENENYHLDGKSLRFGFANAKGTFSPSLKNS